MMGSMRDRVNRLLTLDEDSVPEELMSLTGLDEEGGEDVESNVPTKEFDNEEGDRGVGDRLDPLDSLDDESESSANPLGNPYATGFNILDEVTLCYYDGTPTSLSMRVEGYDELGFYRCVLDNGKILAGLQDSVLIMSTRVSPDERGSGRNGIQD